MTLAIRQIQANNEFFLEKNTANVSMGENLLFQYQFTVMSQLKVSFKTMSNLPTSLKNIRIRLLLK